MATRYHGRFTALDGTAWEVCINDIHYTGAPEEIRFASVPITLFYSETNITDVIQKSQATLAVINQRDGQFNELRAKKEGDVVLKLYTTHKDTPTAFRLYWAGCLDAENIFEPLTGDRNYPIDISFSDFGVAERRKWIGIDFSEHGFYALKIAGISVEDTIRACLDMIGLMDLPIVNHSHTRVFYNPDPGPDRTNILKTIICTDAFFDGDKAPSVWDVLQKMLAPVGLRLIQYAGCIYVYDFDNTEGILPSVRWGGDDSEMSYDTKVGRIELTFDHNEESNIAEAVVAPADVPDICELAIIDAATAEDHRFPYAKFAMRFGRPFSGDMYSPYCGIPVYKMNAGTDGTDSAGAALTFAHGLRGENVRWSTTGDHWSPVSVHSKMPVSFTPIMRSSLGFVNDVRSSNIGAFISQAGERYLRISMDLFLSPRENPFGGDTSGALGDFLKYTRYVLVPINIDLIDDDGMHVLSRYENKHATEGSWTEGVPSSGSWGDSGVYGKWGSWLMFYAEKPSEKSAFADNPWASVRPTRRMQPQEIPALNDYSGLIIRVPGRRGRIAVTVGQGVRCYGTDALNPIAAPDSVYDSIRWCLYKDLKVELLDGYLNPIKQDDIELTQDIDRENKEIYSESYCFLTPRLPAPGLKSQYADQIRPDAMTSVICFDDNNQETARGSVQSVLQKRISTVLGRRRVTLKGLAKEAYSAPGAFDKPYLRRYRTPDGVLRSFVIGSMTFRPRACTSDVFLKETGDGSGRLTTISYDDTAITYNNILIAYES